MRGRVYRALAAVSGDWGCGTPSQKAARAPCRRGWTRGTPARGQPALSVGEHVLPAGRAPESLSGTSGRGMAGVTQAPAQCPGAGVEGRVLAPALHACPYVTHYPGLTRGHPDVRHAPRSLQLRTRPQAPPLSRPPLQALRGFPREEGHGSHVQPCWSTPAPRGFTREWPWFSHKRGDPLPPPPARTLGSGARSSGMRLLGGGWGGGGKSGSGGEGEVKNKSFGKIFYYTHVQQYVHTHIHGRAPPRGLGAAQR